MAHFKTPISSRNKQSLNESILIPESPAMTRIGFGTGVSVFSLERSPRCGQIRSPWAIKRVNKKSDSARYEKLLTIEASILRSLKHPNIVGFRAFGETNDGRKCLAMEECEISLGEKIEFKFEEDAHPFPEKCVMVVAHDIGQALLYLHKECNLLHGDLKSYNILIKGDFEIAKLCDFGVCLKLNSEGFALPDQEYVGTECWCAPEALEGDMELITTKTDMFSFGLVFWEMLCLQPPHASINDLPEDLENEEVLPGVGTRPDLPCNLGDDYNSVIHIFRWCTEANPEQRPSANQLLEYLNSV